MSRDRSWFRPVLVILLAVPGVWACSSAAGPNTPPPGGSGGGGSGGGGSGGMPTPTGGGGGSAPGGSGGGGSGGMAGTGGGSPDGGPAPGNPDGGPAAMGGVAPAGDDYGFLGKPLPVLWFTMGGAPIAAPGLPKAQRTLGTLKVIQDHDGSAVTSIEGKTIALESPILIEGRGSSSYGIFNTYGGQRGYGFEFHNGMRDPVGAALLGMPKNADWALVSCFSDKTCVRNALTYAIGRDLAVPMGRWAPRMRWAEVYFDGVYQGVYSVVERVKDDKSRVNLPDPLPTAPPNEIAYMVSANGDHRSIGTFKAADEFFDQRGRMMPPALNNRRWKYRTPNSENITAPQKAYLQMAIDKVFNTLESGGNWREAIDAPSWIDYFLVSEFTNNVDATFKSWYLYKMPDSMGAKWYMGPIWDFDLAYGNANYYFRYCATNTVIGPLPKVSPGADKDLPPPPYAMAALNDPAFQNDMRCRWNSLRANKGALDIARIEERIDAFVQHVKPAKARDTAKWKNIGVYVWPNNYVGATFEDEVKYLKFWIRTRLAWVDAKLPGKCPSMPAPPAVAQIEAPPSVKVDRTKEAYGGEGALRSLDYVDILKDTSPVFSCPK
jgi:hypothetical protein